MDIPLDFLFNPKSVAIIGVSSEPTKLGTVIFNNMLSAGYEGKLYPVNPKYQDIHGHKCYPTVSEIEGEVDLACIVVPRQFVVDVVTDVGKKGVKGAIIITAGFAETGEEGIKLEKEILEEAKKYNVRILGPNCLGEIIPNSKINLSFAATNAIAGDIAFLSQSGAFCTAVLDMSLETNLGFSHLLSIGNKSDIDENDLVKSWLEDSNVKVIGAYLEDVKAGRDLGEIYRQAGVNKPLIIFKPGESAESRNAISSHTGSLAGAFEAFETAMNQSGISVAKDVDHMFNLLMSYSWSKLPEGNRIAIITNAGGPGVIATDFIIKNNLKLAALSEQTKVTLKSKLPFNASVVNPVDVIGDADVERYKNALEIVSEDTNVDVVIVILTPQLITDVQETADVVINHIKVSNKPIIPIFLGGQYVSLAMKRFYENKVPAFRDISSAIESIASMHRYNQHLKFKDTLEEHKETVVSEYLNQGKYINEVKALLSSDIKALPEDLVMKLAQEVNIDLPKQVVVSNIDEAILFAHDKYPVVLKATTEGIVHKTEKKALYLNIEDEATLRSSYSELESMLRSENAGSTNILVQEQIKVSEEIFIGAARDGGSHVYEEGNKGFGHLLAFGKGGIYTEVYKDIEYSLVPSTKLNISDALSKTKIFEIINGARGKEKLALGALIDTILAVQKLVLLYPCIESLDINPLMLTEDRAVTVDLKIFIKE
jgi:acetyl coenzyme A synthetase (ADP forming)-like protein